MMKPDFSVAAQSREFYRTIGLPEDETKYTIPEGVDLAGYTMKETIDDVEAARKALGYEKINLLGASYGTRLAMIYEWVYPDSLHRVLMAAVNPPGHFAWDAVVMILHSSTV